MSGHTCQGQHVGAALRCLLVLLTAQALCAETTAFEHWCQSPPKAVSSVSDVAQLAEGDVYVRLSASSAEVAQALSRHTSITHLDISSVAVNDDVLRVLLHGLSLKAINISHCGSLTDQAILSLSRESDLQVLYAEGNLSFAPGVLGEIARETDLVALDISYDIEGELDNRNLSYVADFVPLVDKGTLTHFASRNSRWCDDDLIKLLAQLKSLESVDIGNNPLVSTHGVAALLTLPTIQRIVAPLSMENGVRLRDVPACSIDFEKKAWHALRTSTVEYLDVSYRAGFTDDHAYLVMKRAMVKEARLRGMSELGPAGLSFLSKTPSLRRLDIGDCERLLVDTVGFIAVGSTIEDLTYGAFHMSTKSEVNESLAHIWKRTTVRHVTVGLNTTKLSEWSLEKVDLKSLTLELSSSQSDLDLADFASGIASKDSGIGTLTIRGASKRQVLALLPLVSAGPHDTLRFVRCEMEQKTFDRLGAIQTKKRVVID